MASLDFGWTLFGLFKHDPPLGVKADNDIPIFIVCNQGNSCQRVVELLREKGIRAHTLKEACGHGLKKAMRDEIWIRRIIGKMFMRKRKLTR